MAKSTKPRVNPTVIEEARQALTGETPDFQKALDVLAAADSTEGESPQIRLQQLAMEEMRIPVIGTRPYIFHKWSEKAKRMMREKQQSGTRARSKQEPKDPDEEATSCVYWRDEARTKPGIPASQFKAALVHACRFFDGITQVQAKVSMFTDGEVSYEGDELIPLEYSSRIRREDAVRNQTGVADLRYRWAYYPWSCVVPVRYVKSVLDRESVLALINAAGFGGVGDQRPSSPKAASGTFGQFKVDETKEIQVIG